MVVIANGVLLIAISTMSSSLKQLVVGPMFGCCCLARTTVIDTCIMVWLLLSAAQFAWAWNGEVSVVLTAVRYHSDLKKTRVNFVSLLKTMLDCSPLWRTPSRRNWISTIGVLSFQQHGIKITCLYPRSVTVRIWLHFFPASSLTGGRLVQSIEIYCHGLMAISSC